MSLTPSRPKCLCLLFFFFLPSLHFWNKILAGPLSPSLCQSWRILPGIFLEDFLGTFSTKNTPVNPRKDPAAPKQKSAKNLFCQQPTPINPEQLWKHSVSTPISNSEFLEFIGLEISKPCKIKHIPSPKEFQNCATPSTVGTVSFSGGPTPWKIQSWS